MPGLKTTMYSSATLFGRLALITGGKSRTVCAPAVPANDTAVRRVASTPVATRLRMKERLSALSATIVMSTSCC